MANAAQEALDAATAQITAATTVETSAVTLINAMAAAAIAAQVDPASIQRAKDAMAPFQAASDALAAAVVANTPAE